MARLWIMSDLHFETNDTLFRSASFRPDTSIPHDVVVLAGDVHRDIVSGAAWAASAFAKPVILIAGNHEFFGSDVPGEIENGLVINDPRPGRPSPVRFLENRSIVLAGVRFLGCTLWTDFELHGSDRTAIAYAFRDAVRALPDYASILGFMPADARARHLASRAWLEAQLALPFDGPTVVVTHHAPSARSIGESWKGATTSPAYASDLEPIIERWQPDLWIHGHVHERFDYSIGRTRVICNPRGFGHDTTGFDPALIVEL